jgi:hypothetical protein
MRQLFAFLGHSNFTFLLTNATEAKQASSLAVRPENTLGLGIGSRFSRCKQANVNRRMSSRKKKLLRRCLSLSLMAVGLSSTSALAGVVKLDGTSGSNQNSTPINTGSGTELQNGFLSTISLSVGAVAAGLPIAKIRQREVAAVAGFAKGIWNCPHRVTTSPSVPEAPVQPPSLALYKGTTAEIAFLEP